MTMFLLIAVIVLSLIVIGLIVFLYWLFNFTNTPLDKKIVDRVNSEYQEQLKDIRVLRKDYIFRKKNDKEYLKKITDNNDFTDEILPGENDE